MTDPLEIIPASLLLPDDGTVRLAAPSASGMFSVVPDELVYQLALGPHNPQYGHLKDPDELSEYLGAWRNHVISTDKSLSEGIEPQLFGSHLTNAIARVALTPIRLRDQPFSLKAAYKAEEQNFPRQGSGRDPEILGVLFNSLKSLTSTKSF